MLGLFVIMLWLKAMYIVCIMVKDNVHYVHSADSVAIKTRYDSNNKRVIQKVTQTRGHPGPATPSSTNLSEQVRV